jgi:chemotaxis protein histidine kinase CheA
MSANAELLEIMAGFLPEAADLCQKVSRALLSLEERAGAPTPTPDVYKDLARGLHTLKGTSSTLGLDDLSAIAHAMEDVVAPLHKLMRTIPAAIADELLQTLDAFQMRLRAHAEGRSAELGAVDSIVARLRKTVPVVPETAAAVAPTPASPDTPPAAVETSVEEQDWRVNGRDVVSLFREVERMREMRLRVAERRRLVDSALAALAKLTNLPVTANVHTQLVAVSLGLKVDGEDVGDVVDSLEQGIKSMCTLPLRTVVDPLHRLVRDFCRSVGKEAKLSVVGGELSIDRRILERLKGPLVHMARNALDHGIEPPATRLGRGKDRMGSLVIRAEQQGNMFFLEVADDGGGIDCPRIKEVALERELFSSQELSEMSAKETMRIVFEPGFSTRAEVSGTSGRGVGMDVVLAEVEALGGTVDLESTPGQGTRIVLVLPADLGSSPILLVRSGEHQFGLPIVAVEAVVAARSGRIRTNSNAVELKYHEDVLHLGDLGNLMGLCEPKLPSEGQPILIVQAQGRRAAIAVDEVIGDREQLIHPLPPELRSEVSAYQGASVQGFGELLLVLRSEWVVQSVHEGASA